MSPKRTCSGDVDALAECVLPEEMMLCILTRLPVKTIHRFKSVCKPWLKSFSTPEFRKLHRAQFSQNPENESVVIYNLKERLQHAMCLFKIKSTEMKKPIDLGLPVQLHYRVAYFIGCCNGLLCLVFTSYDKIFLWNPALNNSSIYISISTPKQEVGAPRRLTVSLGFGYDEEADDFKVIKFAALENEDRITRVEVYSVNANSWTTIDVDFQYSPLGNGSQTIVNGNLYWSARANNDWVMLCFDVGKAACKIVPIMPIPSCLKGEVFQLPLVNWKGAIAALACKTIDKRILSIDVWVFDDSRETWSKIITSGPIELKMEMVLGVWKNQVLFESDRRKLFAFDTENGGVEEIVVDGAVYGCFFIYEYTESLMFVKGMRNQTQ